MKKSSFDKLIRVTVFPTILCFALLIVIGLVAIVRIVQGNLTPGDTSQLLVQVSAIVLSTIAFLGLLIGVGWVVKKSDETSAEYQKRLKDKVRSIAVFESVVYFLVTLAFVGILNLILKLVKVPWQSVRPEWLRLCIFLAVLWIPKIPVKLIVKRFWKEPSKN